MMKFKKNTLASKMGLALALLGAVAMAPTISADDDDDRDDGDRGALFIMTNSATSLRGNEVTMYDRAENGDLNLVGSFPTGRLTEDGPQIGSGPSATVQVFSLATNGVLPFVSAQADSLGSSDSLILSENNKCLFAVNAGANSITSFRVRDDGLRIASIVDSRGVFPNSLALSKRVLYVLNNGDQGNIAGYRVGKRCSLSPLTDDNSDIVDLTGISESFPIPAPGETITTPSHISFSPDGEHLALAVKGLDGAAFDDDGNLLSLPDGSMAIFPVSDRDSSLGEPTITRFDFAGGAGGPFSFQFADDDTVIVTHANSTSIGAYTLNDDDTLSLNEGGLIPVDSFATCWLDMKKGEDGNDTFVYASSFGIPSRVKEIVGLGSGIPPTDGLISGFRINDDGSLDDLNTHTSYPDPSVLLGKDATGNHGIDVQVIGDYLYFLQPRVGMIGRLTIDREDGSLSNLVNIAGQAPGLEPFATLNPGVDNFLDRCYLADDPAAECELGSIQGIAGF